MHYRRNIEIRIKPLPVVQEVYFVNMKYIVSGYQFGVSMLFDTSYLTIENTVSDHI